MRGVTALIAVIAVAVAGCGSSGSPTTRAGVSLASPQDQQIALARDSNRIFSIFPAKPGETECGIPEGGVHFKPLPGLCATSIDSGQTLEPSLIVTFTERWIDPPCPRGTHCYARIWHHHTWHVIETEPIVTTTSRLLVGPTVQSGATAPQYYK